MSILDRLFPHRKAHTLIVLWETKVRPDLEAEVNAWPDEGVPVQSKKEEKALLKAFLDRTEARIVSLAVVDSVAPHVDKASSSQLGKHELQPLRSR